METITITIPIEPKGKRVPKRAQRGAFHKMYKDKQQVDYENIIAMYLKEKKPKKPIEGEVWLMMTTLMPIPKSKPLWWKRAACKRLIRPITKPDCSNMIKNIEDIMKLMGYFGDDAQIVHVKNSKFYSIHPCWEIGIHYYDDYPKHMEEIKIEILKG